MPYGATRAFDIGPMLLGRPSEKGAAVQLWCMFGICVQKGSELPAGDTRKKDTYCVVIGGNRAIDQRWAAAVF